jgi:hypothetical protein
MEALYALAIPAVVKAVELLNNKDWKSLGKIGLAVLAGGLAGLAGIFPDLAAGLIAGLEASGIVTVAGYAGIKANSAKAT